MKHVGLLRQLWTPAGISSGIGAMDFASLIWALTRMEKLVVNVET